MEKRKTLWHDGKEKPETGRIIYESTDECNAIGIADYDREKDRFDSDDECYWSGSWERCHIKRWLYKKDILGL